MVDCPGIEELPSTDLKRRKIDLNSREQVMRGMIEQSQYAIQYADIILFLYDAKVGINEEDRFIAQWLHRKLKLKEIDVADDVHGSTVIQSQLQRNMPNKHGETNTSEIDKKYVIGVANKVETHHDAHEIIAQGYEFGLGQIVSLSCHSGDGFVDLFHALDDVFQQMDVWRDTNITQAYIDKYVHANDNAFDTEEVTYIPLSQLHDMEKEEKHALNALDTAKHNEELMDSLYDDAFELKYNAQEMDDYDALNIGLIEELDYDEIGKEYEAIESNSEDMEHLKQSEIDKYNKLAAALTDVDIDDAAIGDEEDLMITDDDGALKQLFELKLCIVGRPNVGKSSLVNAILGEHRCMVGDTPGITRDSIAIPMHHTPSGMDFKLIDTAGLLGLNKTSYELQNEGSRLNILVLRECLRSIRFSNIIGIVIDINERVLSTIDYMNLPKKLVYVNNELRRLKLKKKAMKTDAEIEDLADNDASYDELIASNELLSMDDEASAMDKLHNDAVHAARQMLNSIINDFDRQLIEYCISQGRGVVLIINKWDKITSKHRTVLQLLKYSLPLVFRETGGIPICVTSAKYKKGINSFLNEAISIYNKWNSRVPTPILNRFIYEMQKIYPPPSIKQIRKHGRWVRYIRPKVRYMTQYTIRPPSFIAFCGTQTINEYYFYKLRRFLRNEFGLNGVPIRIKMRTNMDINRYDDEYIDRILNTKKKKKIQLSNREKRKGRLRRLSLAEVLKLRKFRKGIKEFEDGSEEKEEEEEEESTARSDDRYKRSMNAMIEELQMTKQEVKMKKEMTKKLTDDRYKRSMNAMIEELQMTKQEVK
eukprot:598590_1